MQPKGSILPNYLRLWMLKLNNRGKSHLAPDTNLSSNVSWSTTWLWISIKIKVKRKKIVHVMWTGFFYVLLSNTSLTVAVNLHITAWICQPFLVSHTLICHGISFSTSFRLNDNAHTFTAKNYVRKTIIEWSGRQQSFLWQKIKFTTTTKRLSHLLLAMKP